MSRRETNNSAVCTGPEDCESSLIPLNHTIVVPGGRYREVSKNSIHPVLHVITGGSCRGLNLRKQDLLLGLEMDHRGFAQIRIIHICRGPPGKLHGSHRRECPFNTLKYDVHATIGLWLPT